MGISEWCGGKEQRGRWVGEQGPGPGETGGMCNPKSCPPEVPPRTHIWSLLLAMLCIRSTFSKNLLNGQHLLQGGGGWESLRPRLGPGSSESMRPRPLPPHPSSASSVPAPVP